MLPTWAMALPWDAISKHAYDQALSPKLVAAIVFTESRGDPYAVRYEPNWRYHTSLQNRTDLANELGITVETETIMQSTSWGLMQIMGATARSAHQFDRQLTELVDIDTNLEIGCRHLSWLCSKHDSMEKAIVSYNAGSPRIDKDTGKYVNQAYLDKVLNYLRSLDT